MDDSDVLYALLILIVDVSILFYAHSNVPLMCLAKAILPSQLAILLNYVPVPSEEPRPKDVPSCP